MRTIQRERLYSVTGDKRLPHEWVELSSTLRKIVKGTQVELITAGLECYKVRCASSRIIRQILVRGDDYGRTRECLARLVFRVNRDGRALQDILEEFDCPIGDLGLVEKDCAFHEHGLELERGLAIEGGQRLRDYGRA